MSKKKTYIILVFVLLVVLVSIVLFKLNNTDAVVSDSSQLGPSPSSNINTSYGIVELSVHSDANDCWLAIDGKVYDVTDYIASGRHNPQILKGCGQDATDMFNQERKHSGKEAQSLLSKYIIGVLQ